MTRRRMIGTGGHRRDRIDRSAGGRALQSPDAGTAEKARSCVIER